MNPNRPLTRFEGHLAAYRRANNWAHSDTYSIGDPAWDAVTGRLGTIVKITNCPARPRYAHVDVAWLFPRPGGNVVCTGDCKGRAILSRVLYHLINMGYAFAGWAGTDWAVLDSDDRNDRDAWLVADRARLQRKAPPGDD